MKIFRNSLFVLFVFFAFVLAACGGGGSPAPGTNSQPPIVSVAAATGVTVDAATLNGNVNPNGNATTVWFEWGTSPTLASYTAMPSQSIGSGVASVAVTANLTGLTQGTTYYARVCGQSSADLVKSGIVSFTTGTPAAPPTVQTFAPSGVTTTAATLNGGVNPNGLSTTAWFEWGTSPTLASYTPTASQSIGSGVASVAVTANLIGLASSTTYYYRACASSSAGTIRGSITLVITQTPGIPPTVTTLGATAITTTTATLNANVNPHGLATTASFDWGTSPTLATFTTTASQSVGSGSVAVPVSVNLTGLAPNTTYYYRPGATNSAGSNIGTIASFTTHVVTGIAPAITGLAVGTPSGGNVSATLTVDPKDPTAVTDGWLEITQDNILWTPTAHQTVNPGGVVTLNFPLTSLPAGVTYIRGRASNSWGADLWQKGDRVTIAQDNGTLNLLAERWDTIYLYTEFDVPVMTIAGNGLWNPISLPPAGYKLYMIRSGLLYAVVNDADNNVFRLNPGCTLNMGGVSSSAAGRLRRSTSGTGFTTDYQAPVIHSGTAWNQTETVFESTNNSIPVGTVANYTQAYSQSEFLISQTSPVFGTIYGVVNGTMVINMASGWSDGWSLTYKETWTVNPSGTSLTGITEETWSMAGQPDAYVKATLTGWR